MQHELEILITSPVIQLCAINMPSLRFYTFLLLGDMKIFFAMSLPRAISDPIAMTEIQPCFCLRLTSMSSPVRIPREIRRSFVSLGRVTRATLLETFLVDVLDFDRKEAHKEACELEHAVSDAVLERLYEFLGSPEYCPDGNPINLDKNNITQDEKFIPLDEMEEGSSGKVAILWD